MKNVLKTWKWSFAVVARSPLALAALAIVFAAQLYAAYRWLYFPMESAVYLMVIGALWAVVVFAVLAGLVAVSVAATLDAAAADARRIEPRSLLRFNRCGVLRAAGFLILAVLISSAVYYFFEWANSYSLEVASWLTFSTEKPVAQESAEAVMIWIERFLWIVALGFLMGFLVTLLRGGWPAALRAAPRLLANSCWRSPFLTSLLSLLVFGGIACLLINWNPTVTPGYLDFAQVILRNGLAIVVAVAGSIFWILALARHGAPAAAGPASTPDRR